MVRLRISRPCKTAPGRDMQATAGKTAALVIRKSQGIAGAVQSV